MQFFHAQDGAQLAFRDEGRGLPLLGLAGLTRDSRDFDYLARQLPPDVRLIRLDSRGRGRSAWTGASTYTVGQETSDVLALLDHLQLPRVAILGSSRGGLLAMLIGATQPQRLLGICLNDVGPALEREGLERISRYVGIAPAVSSLNEILERLPAASPGFYHVAPSRWAQEAVRHFEEYDGRVHLTYDPEIRTALMTAMQAPPVDLWPLFDACKPLPLALIRAEYSDVLSRETALEMQRRRPDMIWIEARDRGHIPFLDEREVLEGLQAWLNQVRERLNIAVTQ